MALKGLDIFKLLPKTNCKDCGHPTCLAFAMALAAAKISLDRCPHISEEAKETLGGASAPPIKLVKVGKDDCERVLGDETVLFRHDKTFFHPTCFAVSVSDALAEDALAAKIEKINALCFERVGQSVSVDLIALKNDSKDADSFGKAAKILAEKGKFAAVLISEDPAAMEKALSALAAQKPLIYAATEANHEKMTALAQQYDCPLVVKGDGLDATAALAEKVAASYKELVIDVGTRQLSQALAEITQTRRLAIKKRFRPLGYPVIAFTAAEDACEEVVEASVLAAKYASIIVMRTDEKAHYLPLMAQRMDIYTDPQKPSQVEPKAYAIGAVTKDSPVYLTTNFSLTYYTVEGEISSSKIPSYLIACPTDGTSVLTAWSAGKYGGKEVSAYMETCGIGDMVNHKRVVIPGYVAIIKGALEEESGWEVLVGPQEASGIPAYAKKTFA